MGDHWLLGKCGYFDQSYRIPLIIRDPRKGADAGRGTVVERFSENRSEEHTSELQSHVNLVCRLLLEKKKKKKKKNTKKKKKKKKNKKTIKKKKKKKNTQTIKTKNKKWKK